MTDATVLFAVREFPQSAGTAAEQLRKIRDELKTHGLEVRWAGTADDARAVLRTEAALAAAVVDWDLPHPATGGGDTGGAEVLRHVGRRFHNLPVFLATAGEDLEHLPLWVAETVIGYLWPLEDTAPFIAGRIAGAARGYQHNLLPPFFKALRRFDHAHEYSWHTPAHSGGVAFLKSPVGRAFHDYFGERLLRSDLSISVGELGSLFEHTGPVGAAERNAARVFGADRTYFVLHGDSTCDRMVGHFSVTQDEIALVDRNCHKSVLHGLVLSGARPVYLVPTRNGYGLAGPLPPAEIQAPSVASRAGRNPLAQGAVSPTAQYAVLTNSTYDGLCYDTLQVAQALAPSTPRLHFD
ncbi:Orn/Lys/Arg decarboxylase N-terminal domain-containing protein, partial [Streptomyces lydicus]|uniref:Orn/Lys/Arg decarboxylase N-terminal domain-containing protein n=1 Tax=Streptomyces lydicus TaxID=47763 RepID=UPI0037BD1B21